MSEILLKYRCRDCGKLLAGIPQMQAIQTRRRTCSGCKQSWSIRVEPHTGEGWGMKQYDVAKFTRVNSPKKSSNGRNRGVIVTEWWKVIGRPHFNNRKEAIAYVKAFDFNEAVNEGADSGTLQELIMLCASVNEEVARSVLETFKFDGERTYIWLRRLVQDGRLD